MTIQIPTNTLIDRRKMVGRMHHLPAATLACVLLANVACTPAATVVDPLDNPENLLLQALLANVTHVLAGCGAQYLEVAADSEEPMALTASSCPAVTTTPQTLDPNHLPASFTVQWLWSTCLARADTSESGSQRADVVMNPNGVTTTSFQSSFQRQSAYTLMLDSNATMTSSGQRSEGTVHHDIVEAGLRSRAGLNAGEPSYSLNYNNVLAVSEERDPTTLILRQRVVDGSGTVQQSPTAQPENVLYSHLVYYPRCCYPASGSLQHQAVDPNGHIAPAVMTFGSTCGLMYVNGAALQLPVCQ